MYFLLQQPALHAEVSSQPSVVVSAGSSPLKMQKPLSDVVALVISKPLGPVDTKAAITEKLLGLGARVASRLGKEVTHIIFQRLRSADPQELLAEESELRAVYDKVSKVPFPAVST